jgi:hypothetical protein
MGETPTWDTLFAHVDEKCNFHYGGEETSDNFRWTCHHDLRFAKSFCNEHGVDWAQVKERLHATGGHCDCEIIWNTTRRFSEADAAEPLPLLASA